jgi:uncharacterized protein (DUF488 family)
LLQAHRAACVVDVRTVPRSRHNPQFNRDTLPISLKAVQVGYKHMAGLGGLRHAQSDSVNLGWRNASFRGYADYMHSEAGRVQGTIKKVIVSATRFKTYTVRASAEEPQYLIKSDKTDHLAVHKGAALEKIRK